MREFVNKHPRLYFVIVGIVALIAFLFVTVVGMCRVKRADAATLTSPNAEVDYVTLPSYQEVVEKVVEYFGVDASEVTSGNTVMFSFGNGMYYIYHGNAISNLTMTVYSWGFALDAKFSTQHVTLFNGEWSSSSASGRIASMNFSSVNPYWGYLWGVQINCVNGVIDKRVDYPKPMEFDKSSAYASLGFGYVNKIAEGDTKVGIIVFEDIYDDYTTESKWQFDCRLRNMSTSDISYTATMRFKVEIPHDIYIRDLAELNGIDLTSVKQALTRTPEMVKHWYKYYGGSFDEYVAEIEVPLVVASNGDFDLEFTFPQIEYFLMGKSDAFRERFAVYNADDNTYWKALVLSYMHLKQLDVTVYSHREDGIHQGPISSIAFDRGYEHYWTANTPVDKGFASPSAVQTEIAINLRANKDAHLQDLENRIDQLESDLNNQNGILTGFDTDFSGNALWGAVRSVGSGIIGMSSFLTGFASVVGSFFGFLPYDMQQIIGYTVIVGVVLVLWRLFKK